MTENLAPETLEVLDRMGWKWQKRDAFRHSSGLQMIYLPNCAGGPEWVAGSLSTGTIDHDPYILVLANRVTPGIGQAWFPISRVEAEWKRVEPILLRDGWTIETSTDYSTKPPTVERSAEKDGVRITMDWNAANERFYWTATGKDRGCDWHQTNSDLTNLLHLLDKRVTLERRLQQFRDDFCPKYWSGQIVYYEGTVKGRPYIMARRKDRNGKFFWSVEVGQDAWRHEHPFLATGDTAEECAVALYEKLEAGNAEA